MKLGLIILLSVFFLGIATLVYADVSHSKYEKRLEEVEKEVRQLLVQRQQTIQDLQAINNKLLKLEGAMWELTKLKQEAEEDKKK